MKFVEYLPCNINGRLNSTILLFSYKARATRCRIRSGDIRLDAFASIRVCKLVFKFSYDKMISVMTERFFHHIVHRYGFPIIDATSYRLITEEALLKMKMKGTKGLILTLTFIFSFHSTTLRLRRTCTLYGYGYGCVHVMYSKLAPWRCDGVDGNSIEIPYSTLNTIHTRDSCAED